MKRHDALSTHHVYVCLLWWLPVANFGQQKVVVTYLCTFDCPFCMAEPGRTVMGGMVHVWVGQNLVKRYILRVFTRSLFKNI